MGLEALHQLTSQGSWSLHIKMVDYDQKAYVAVYDQFKVLIILVLSHNYCKLCKCCLWTAKNVTQHFSGWAWRLKL